MPTLPFTYDLVSVGVNDAPGTRRLRHAERDALSLARVFASELGPVQPSDAVLLAGEKKTATRRGLDRVLLRAARRHPRFFAFAFCGHGNRSGIVLSEGSYPFTRLRARIKAIGARATIVMLDCCQAGGYVRRSQVAGLAGDEAVSAAWGVQLLAAIPRVFMASSADTNTVEIDGLGGVFAHALTRAMLAPVLGDLSLMGTDFVSDALVFARAAVIMRHFGLRPESGGTFGGFPMVRAHSEPFGETSVVSVKPVEGFGVSVDLAINDRRFLPTQIIASAIDGYGNVFAEQRAVSVPPRSDFAVKTEFALDELSDGCLEQLAYWRACRVTWDIAVLDGEGRLLDRGRYVADYTA